MRRLLRFCFRTFLLFAALTASQVIWLKFFAPPFTPQMALDAWRNYQEHGQLGWRYQWREWEALSPHLAQALIVSEDPDFMRHFGVTTSYIQEFQELHSSRKRQGPGRTLTQRTADLAFLWDGSGSAHQVLNTWYTLLIELIWPKSRTLELYLNLMPVGQSMYGAEAAAQNYFQQSASELSRQQAARIIAALPNPKHFKPNEDTEYMTRRVRWLEQASQSLPELFQQVEHKVDPQFQEPFTKP